MQPTNNHINYVEFKSTDLEATKTFYSNAFGWQFTDYGDSYIAFENSGLQCICVQISQRCSSKYLAHNIIL